MVSEQSSKDELISYVRELEARLEQAEASIAERYDELTVLTQMLEQAAKNKPFTYSAHEVGLLSLVKQRLFSRHWVKFRYRFFPGRFLGQIRESSWFDGDWYLASYPDVAHNPKASSNPALHYLRFGGFEGRNPGPDFDSDWYLRTNPDVRASGINPLLHFLAFGEREERPPKPEW